MIANARLFTKGDKQTFNAAVINEAVIQFGKTQENLILYHLLT